MLLPLAGTDKFRSGAVQQINRLKTINAQRTAERERCKWREQNLDAHLQCPLSGSHRPVPMSEIWPPSRPAVREPIPDSLGFGKSWSKPLFGNRPHSCRLRYFRRRQKSAVHSARAGRRPSGFGMVPSTSSHCAADDHYAGAWVRLSAIPAAVFQANPFGLQS
jgi:hypothetical protein